MTEAYAGTPVNQVRQGFLEEVPLRDVEKGSACWAVGTYAEVGESTVCSGNQKCAKMSGVLGGGEQQIVRVVAGWGRGGDSCWGWVQERPCVLPAMFGFYLKHWGVLTGS